MISPKSQCRSPTSNLNEREQIGIDEPAYGTSRDPERREKKLAPRELPALGMKLISHGCLLKTTSLFAAITFRGL
jgi:hypothetical protein